MQTYCSYCDTKIFSEDRHCLTCAAPIKKSKVGWADSTPNNSNMYKTFHHGSGETYYFHEGFSQPLLATGWSENGFIALCEKNIFLEFCPCSCGNE